MAIIITVIISDSECDHAESMHFANNGDDKYNNQGFQMALIHFNNNSDNNYNYNDQWFWMAPVWTGAFW